MSWRFLIPNERLIGFGLTAAATAGVYMGIRALIDTYHSAFFEVPTQPKTQYITQETEDSLSLDTLNSLLDHYNYSIRETAAKIVCDRAINDDATLNYLLLCIARPGYDERMMSLRALAMLTDQNTLHRLNTAEGFSAFVKSLEHCVKGKEGQDNEDDGAGAGDVGPRASRRAADGMIDDLCYDEYHLRDMAEKLCLMFLAQLTDKFDVELLVQAGFVEKWLAKQPWVTTVIADPAAATAARIHNFSRYLKYRDNRIADICRRIRESPAGWTALEKAQLVAPRREREHRVLKNRIDVQGVAEDRDRQFIPVTSSPLRVELRVVDGNVVATASAEDGTGNGNGNGNGNGITRTVLGVLEGEGAPDGEGTGGDAADAAQQAARRPSQNTRAEQQIRRQHREAMVLNDGTRPLRRDDIIERESD